jgi:hypothetical protein
MSTDLITTLRQYADVAEAGDKPHWATAMRRAAQRIAVLQVFVADGCACPCCEADDVCEAECTFATDHPHEFEALEYAREVMREGA